MTEIILFLLTSVLTARFLKQRKMRVAAALYAVMFTVLLGLLCFAVDIPWLREALINLFGITRYHLLHVISFWILDGSFGGISIIAFIAFSLAVQLGIGIYFISKQVVHKLIKRAPYCKIPRTYRSKIKNTFVFYPYTNINRLYCRMLN